MYRAKSGLASGHLAGRAGIGEESLDRPGSAGERQVRAKALDGLIATRCERVRGHPPAGLPIGSVKSSRPAAQVRERSPPRNRERAAKVQPVGAIIAP